MRNKHIKALRVRDRVDMFWMKLGNGLGNTFPLRSLRTFLGSFHRSFQISNQLGNLGRPPQKWVGEGLEAIILLHVWWLLNINGEVNPNKQLDHTTCIGGTQVLKLWPEVSCGFKTDFQSDVTKHPKLLFGAIGLLCFLLLLLRDISLRSGPNIRRHHGALAFNWKFTGFSLSWGKGHGQERGWLD